MNSNRGKRNLFLKHFLVVIIIFSLVITPTVVKPDSADGLTGAAVGKWAAGKVGAASMTLVKSGFMKAFGKVVEDIDNDSLTAIYGFVQGTSFLGDPIQKSCDRILSELTYIEDQIDKANQSTQKTLNEMFTYDITENLKDRQDKLDDVYDICDKINEAYNEYIKAVDDYAKATADYDANPTAQNKKQKNETKNVVSSKKIQLENRFQNNNFNENFRTIAQNACKFYPDGNKDHKIGENKTSKSTYLEELWTLLGQTVPFDHQKYEAMEAGINDCAKTVVSVIRAYNVYYDYMDAKYQTNYKAAVNDGTIKDKKKRNELSAEKEALGAIKDDYSKSIIKTTQCLNDISDQYEKELFKLMKPYDVDTSQKMVYANPGKHYGYYWGGTSRLTYTAYANRSQEYSDFYRVGVNGNQYLILQDYYLSERDYVETVVYRRHKDQVNEYDFPSQDFYNLKTTKSGQFELLSSIDQLKEFVNTNAYKAADYNIPKYIHEKGQLEKVPHENVTYIISSEVSKHASLELVNFSYTSSFYWYKPSFSPDNTKKARTKVVMMKANRNSSTIAIYPKVKGYYETFPVITKRSDSRGTIEVTHSDGKKINGKVKAGERLNIKVTLKDGVDLSSLAFVSKDGKTEDVLATTEIFNAIKDENNSYTFSYTMPYQDCTFEAKFDTATSKGEGTEDSPYIISGPDDFTNYLIKASDKETKEHYNSASYILTNDIDMSKIEINDNNENFKPRFELFSGTFDGNGHTITGTNTYLFKGLTKEAIVKDLTIDLSSKNTRNESGLVDKNNGTINGCTAIFTAEVYCSISGSDKSPIGVFVTENNGTIKNCTNLINIFGSNVAGIAAVNDGSIQNCYNMGAIKYNGKDDKGKTAGIAINSSGVIENCYYGGDFSPINESLTGEYAPIAFSSKTQKEATNTYYDEKYKSTNTLGEPLSKDQMRSDYMKDKLNSQVTLHSSWKKWQNSQKNYGYPYLDAVVEKHTISNSVKGKGSIIISDSNDKNITSSLAGNEITVKMNPEDGYSAAKLTVLDKAGKVIETPKIKSSDKQQQATFEMPNQDINITAIFSKKIQKSSTPSSVSKDEPSNESEKDDDWPVIKNTTIEAITPGSIISSDKDTITVAGEEHKTLTWPLDEYGEYSTIDQKTGIRVVGKYVNHNAVLQIKEYDKDSALSDSVQSSVGDDVLKSFDISFVQKDKNGKIIKSDMPNFIGDLYIYFPIDDLGDYEDLKVAHDETIGYNIIDGKKTKNDMFRVHVTHLSSFSLIDHTDEIVENLSEQSADDNKDSNMGLYIMLIILAIIIIGAGIVLFIRYRLNKLKLSNQNDVT